MISVCMATFNGERFIREQIESILAQLSQDDELIISDDGSSDSTCEIIRSFADERIHLIFNQGEHGFTPNFENALTNARGDFIFLSDQDDVWLDGKVDKMLRALETNDLAISDCITVNESLEILQQSRFEAFHIRPGFLRHFIKSRYLGCCMAFKRSFLSALLPFPRNGNLVEHDIWIAAMGFLYYRVGLIKTPLIYYRRHGQNASDGGFVGGGYPLLVKIQKRVYRLEQLALRLPKVLKYKQEAQCGQ